MKILIIEDEIRAVSQLQSMLTVCNFPFELLAIIDTVEDAVNWFKLNENPDLVFMDIQLADGLSFEIFQKTIVNASIIFTTAFDQYAIQAFKVNSVDYLLKPIQKEDLRKALDKFGQSNSASGLDVNTLKQLLSDLQGSAERDGILVKSGNSFVPLKISDLQYCYSEDSITFGVTATKRFIIDETLDELYETLDHSRFFKINRRQIVAKSSVLKIEPYFNHRVVLTMTNSRDQEFVVSRSKTSEFKKWMNQ